MPKPKRKQDEISNDGNDSNSNNGGAPENKRPRGEDSYFCHVCGQTFGHADERNVAQKVQVSGTKTCPHCRSLEVAWCITCRKIQQAGGDPGYSCETPAQRIKPEDIAKGTKFSAFIQYATNAEADKARKQPITEARAFAAELENFLETYNLAPQSTFCVSVLRKGVTYETRVTYSHYDYINVPVGVRKLCGGKLLKDADPLIYHPRPITGLTGHYVFERGPKYFLEPRTPPAKLTLKAAELAEESLQYAGSIALFEPQRGQHPNQRNYHHAEMRALTYANKNSYQIIYLRPTRDCCMMCNYTLTKLKISDAPLINFVDAERRGESSWLIKELRDVIDARINTNTASTTTAGKRRGRK